MVVFARFILVSCLVASAGPGLVAQQPPASADRRQDNAPASLVTIGTALKTIAGLQQDLRTKQAEAAAEKDDARRLALLVEAAELQKRLAAEQRTLEIVATGIDLAEIDAADDRVDLTTEVKSLLQPLVEQLKDLTAEPRQVEKLKADLAAATRRLGIIERGLQRLEMLSTQTADPEVLAALEGVKSSWVRERDRVVGNQQAARVSLEEKERVRRPFLETFQELLGTFFRERGLNLVLALSAFLVVLLGLRWLYMPVANRIPRERRNRFSVRLLAVLYHTLVFVLAAGSALVVLYAAGDWVLLGLAGLFIFGLAWAGKHTLPRFYQEARLLLNLGDVREGERVILDGLPWRIDRLHLYTRLSNPALTGGVLRRPLHDLIGLRSRADSEREPWFPCFEGDWVVIDSALARVLVQTPQTVVLATQGARRSMTTSAFLAANPTNISSGFGFRVAFGIDYRHQAVATTEVPAAMQSALARELPKQPGGDGLVSLKVELLQAGTSSLDYAVIAEFKGTSAPAYLSLQRAVQTALVDLCNAKGWVIPFPQLTVHQAG